MNGEAAVYLDASALVKLVIVESESKALADHLRAHPSRVSCGLSRVEVVGAVRAHGRAAVNRARGLLARVSLLRLDDVLLDAAAALGGTDLGGLDAIHLAAAQSLGDSLSEVITYDQRMIAAAREMGLTVVAPAG